MCTALNQPIDAVFPGSSKAIASYQKELKGPTHVSRETYDLLRKVGLEGDTRQHTIKVPLRGHRESMFFDTSPSEAARLFSAVQGETADTAQSAFVVFNTERIRVAINLRAAVFFHFLWDPAVDTITADEGDREDGQTQAVHVFFNEADNPTIVSAEAEDGADFENERNYINDIFLDLDTGGIGAHERRHIVDEDGERILTRGRYFAADRAALGSRP
jgi:hypothetical protein